MADIGEFYTRQVRERAGYLATWLPGRVLYLGDIGAMEGDEFAQTSNLQVHGISYDERPAGQGQDIELTSSDDVRIDVTVAGKTPSSTFKTLGEADAGLVVTFGRHAGFVIQAAGVSQTNIGNLEQIEDAIRDQSQQDIWRRTWRRTNAVVSELVTAQVCTILIAESSDAHVELKATADISPEGLTLANADAKFVVTSAEGVTTRIVAATGLTPLFRAVRFHVGLDVFGQPLGGGEFETLT